MLGGFSLTTQGIQFKGLFITNYQSRLRKSASLAVDTELAVLSNDPAAQRTTKASKRQEPGI